MSLADQILAANDIVKEPVSLPEWGLAYPDPASPDAPARIYVSVISGEDRDALEESCAVQRGKKRVQNLANFRAKVAVKCLVDESGVRVFTEHHIAALGKKSSAPLQTIFNAATKLNKWSEEDIEELVKN